MNIKNYITGGDWKTDAATIKSNYFALFRSLFEFGFQFIIVPVIPIRT